MIEHSTMKIKNTDIRDLDRVCQLWHDAIAFQKSKGYPEYLWDDRERQKQSILSGHHYKLTQGDNIIGVFNIQTSDKAIWRAMDQNNAIYLHGVLIDTKYKGQKLFQNILDWTVSYAKSHNKLFIRLDTWANNPPLENYYKQFGFEVIEEFQIPDCEGIPLNCRGNRVVLMQYTVQLKKFMIIEHFRSNKVKELYDRYNEKGRMLPNGVKYIDSWIDENVKVCYQLMESKSKEKIEEWISYWSDLADFQVVPVISSQEAKDKILSK